MIFNQNRAVLLSLVTAVFITTGCSMAKPVPKRVSVANIAQNPEGIEYDKIDNTFLLSSINAKPVIKIKPDGSFVPFTSGEKFPLSTAGLQIDYRHNRLLVAGFNGMELMDNKPETKGAAFLRIYDLKTGKLKQEINLSSLLPNAQAYFANDVAVDDEGNAYVTDWYAKAVYKVGLDGKASLLWKNDLSKVKGGANGIDYHKDGYLVVSLLNVNKRGLYDDYALIKIPLDKPKKVSYINMENEGFSGFDGMVIKENGNIIGVTNDQKSPGGNTLIELSSNNDYTSATVINAKNIPASTTVAVTPDNDYYVIEQDFTDNFKKEWIINKIGF